MHLASAIHRGNPSRLSLSPAWFAHYSCVNFTTPTIYVQAQTCLDAIWTIADEVLDSSAKIASCLRMSFHDSAARDASANDGG